MQGSKKSFLIKNYECKLEVVKIILMCFMLVSAFVLFFTNSFISSVRAEQLSGFRIEMGVFPLVGAGYKPTFGDFLVENPMVVGVFIMIACIMAVAVVVIELAIRKSRVCKQFALVNNSWLGNFWNMNYFQKIFKEVIKKNPSKKFVILSVDIAKFSGINEMYGREVGNEVIKKLGLELSKYAFSNDCIAHNFVDQFFLLMEFCGEEKLLSTAEEIKSVFNVYKGKGFSIKTNLYFGAYIVEKGISCVSAIDNCEMARKRARNIQSKFKLYDKALENEILREKDIEDSMEEALERGEFEVYFQPKFDIQKGKIYGAEALVRWKKKDGTMLYPKEFIPIFEGNGFIVELDFFVLEEVFKMISEWRSEGRELYTISVNQSRIHFQEFNYEERLNQLVLKYEIPERVVELEITETILCEREVLTGVLSKIKSLGFLVSIDDFGSEYSSPILLKEATIDVVKLDRNFIHSSLSNERAIIIIEKMVDMSAALGLELVCEGIEEESQDQILRRIGCQKAQGFYYAMPMPKQEFLNLIDRQNSLNNAS